MVEREEDSKESVSSSGSDTIGDTTGDGSETLTEKTPEEKYEEELLDGVDVTDPQSVAGMVQKISPDASVALRELLAENKELQETLEQTQESLAQAREKITELEKKNTEQIKQIRGTDRSSFLIEFLSIREDIHRAFQQERGEDIKDGMGMVAEQFDAALEENGVTIVEPSEGASVNPERHIVMAKRKSESIQEGNVIECHKRGYVVEGYVIEEAHVSVSSGNGD